jgi:uncharacterized protein YodC (DUF2158 family)
MLDISRRSRGTVPGRLIALLPIPKEGKAARKTRRQAFGHCPESALGSHLGAALSSAQVSVVVQRCRPQLKCPEQGRRVYRVHVTVRTGVPRLTVKSDEIYFPPHSGAWATVVRPDHPWGAHGVTKSQSSADGKVLCRWASRERIRHASTHRRGAGRLHRNSATLCLHVRPKRTRNAEHAHIRQTSR